MAGAVQLRDHARIDVVPVHTHDDAAQDRLVDALAQHRLLAQVSLCFFRNELAQPVVQGNSGHHIDDHEIELGAQKFARP